jgi:hypothetical protein
MNQGVASAVFDSQSEADRAVSELRSAGASDKSISIIAQHGGKNTSTDGAGEKTGDLSARRHWVPVSARRSALRPWPSRVSDHWSRPGQSRKARSAEPP